MTKHLTSIITAAAVTMAARLVGHTNSTNASAKVTIQTPCLNVLGPITASTGTTSSDNQNGTFTAAGLMGKGTLTAESVRLAKDQPFPYVIGMK